MFEEGDYKRREKEKRHKAKVQSFFLASGKATMYPDEWLAGSYGGSSRREWRALLMVGIHYSTCSEIPAPVPSGFVNRMVFRTTRWELMSFQRDIS